MIADFLSKVGEFARIDGPDFAVSQQACDLCHYLRVSAIYVWQRHNQFCRPILIPVLFQLSATSSKLLSFTERDILVNVYDLWLYNVAASVKIGKLSRECSAVHRPDLEIP